MDRLSELGTARGFAQQRVARAKRELAEAEIALAESNIAHWGYVNSEPCPDCGHTLNAHGDGSGKGCYFCGCLT